MIDAMRPYVEVIYRGPAGSIRHKFLPWLRRPQTDEALAEYIDDYFEMVTSGYRPKGYEIPPLPHCARVHFLGRIVAEWHLSPAFLPESLGTGSERAGSAGMPTAAPSAPCLERQEVPTLSDPCGNHSNSASIDRDPHATARPGQATLTTG